MWTKSTVVKASQDANNEWDVTAQCAEGSTRVLHVQDIMEVPIKVLAPTLETCSVAIPGLGCPQDSPPKWRHR